MKVFVNLTFLFFLLIFFGAIANAQSTGEIIFEDNFNSGIATWDQNAGTWSAATDQLVGGSFEPSAINHEVDMPIGSDYNIMYKNDPNVAGQNSIFYWFTDSEGISGLSGYSVLIQSGTTQLRRTINGSTTVLFSGSGHSTGTLHNINVYHSSDGNISLWIDGTFINSVVDNNFTNGSKILISTTNDTGDGIWDDVNILKVTQSPGFFIVDEEEPNTGINANLTINGIPWPVSSNGNFDVNSDISFPATFSVSATGYDNRTFSYDTNQGLQMIKRLGLRQSSESKDISFKFFEPDEITELPNRWIYSYRIVSGVEILSGRGQTDSSGKITFNLAPQDNIYDFNIFKAGSEFGDTNVQYNYDAITVTVKQPIDEKSNNTISGNYDIDVGGLGSQNITNVNGDQDVFVLSNTIDTYNIKIDDNNAISDNYFAREYAISFTGNPITATLQPYLVGADDGTAVNFIVKDKFSQNTISDLLLTMERDIGGELVTVEERVTNEAGLAQFIFLGQTTYLLTISDPNTGTTYLTQGQYQSSVTQYTINIPFTGSDQNFSSFDLNITVSPENLTILSGTSQVIDVNVQSNYADSISIQILDGNTVKDSESGSFQDLNASFNVVLGDFNQFVFVQIKVDSFGTSSFYRKTYIILEETPGLFGSIQGVKDSVGLIGALILTIIGVLLALQAFGPSITGNNESQLFLVIVVMSIFGILFFYDPNLGINEIDPMVPLYAAIFFGIIGWYWKEAR